MNKRGQAEVWNLKFLAETILSAMIVAFLIFAALNFNRFNNFDKVARQEDLKLLINALGSANGRITYNNYPLGSNRDLVISNRSLRIIANKNILEQSLKLGYDVENGKVLILKK